MRNSKIIMHNGTNKELGIVRLTDKDHQREIERHIKTAFENIQTTMENLEDTIGSLDRTIDQVLYGTKHDQNSRFPPYGNTY